MPWRRNLLCAVWLAISAFLAIGPAKADPLNADKAISMDTIVGVPLCDPLPCSFILDKTEVGSNPVRRLARQPQSLVDIQAAKVLQAALNHFGFDAGTEDGIPGPRTRAAVASYQETLGHPQTGKITDEERQLLLDSMVRERLNPSEAVQLAAANPFGRSGLPAEYRRKSGMPLATPATTTSPAAADAP